jgi:hypothetical protein
MPGWLLRKELAASSAWKPSREAWDSLDDLRFSTTDASVFRNATIILMTAVGRSKASIAADLGCCSATVDNVRQRYRERGLAGLRRRKPPKRKSEATPEYRAAAFLVFPMTLVSAGLF